MGWNLVDGKDVYSINLQCKQQHARPAMNASLRTNPFLSGNFAPIRSEDDFAELAVEGEIPRELRGTLFRNGPNPQFEPRDPDHHWFAGDGMIHAFRFADGKVSYRNRYVRTPRWEAEHAASRSLFGTFGNPLTSDPSVTGTDSGVANTNIIFHAGRLLALEEAHQPFELDPESRAPRGYVPYAGRANHFTAHPKIDPETDELMFFGYMAGEGFFPIRSPMAWSIPPARLRVSIRSRCPIRA
jgi:carotenoid cleavage dioxygenase-like enzyme